MELYSIRSSKEKMKIVLPVAIIVCILLGLGTWLVFFHQRFNLSEPVSGKDYLFVQKERFTVQAGKPIFGYDASLKNYIRVFTNCKQGGSSFESWIDTDGRACYLVPLFDGEKMEDGLFISRNRHHQFTAATGHANDIRQYHHVYKSIQQSCKILNYQIKNVHLLVTNGGYLLVAETDQGFYGEAFALPPTGAMNSAEPVFKEGILMNGAEMIDKLKILNSTVIY